MEEYLRIGVISSSHGIKGEAKVFPTTDDPKRFKKLKRVFLDLKDEKKEVQIEQVKFFKQFVILKMKGIDSIEDVERYKGKDLVIERKDALPLKEDEYFIGDLIGIRVVTENGEELGRVKDVLQTGANDVYVVEREGEKEVLLPAIRECILKVDLEKGEMRVHVMEGLLDL